MNAGPESFPYRLFQWAALSPTLTFNHGHAFLNRWCIFPLECEIRAAAGKNQREWTEEALYEQMGSLIFRAWIYVQATDTRDKEGMQL